MSESQAQIVLTHGSAHIPLAEVLLLQPWHPYLAFFFFKQNLLCIFLLDTKHAHIMQDEAATTRRASLFRRRHHCTQSTASTSAGTSAIITTRKPLLSQNLALPFRLPSKQ